MMPLTPEHLEKAVAHWLPDVWTPGKCSSENHAFPTRMEQEEVSLACDCGGFNGPVPVKDGIARMPAHNTPCPPLTRDLAMRLLEAMRADFVKSTNWREWYNLMLNIWGNSDTLDAIALAAYELAIEATK